MTRHVMNTVWTPSHCPKRALLKNRPITFVTPSLHQLNCIRLLFSPAAACNGGQSSPARPVSPLPTRPRTRTAARHVTGQWRRAARRDNGGCRLARRVCSCVPPGIPAPAQTRNPPDLGGFGPQMQLVKLDLLPYNLLALPLTLRFNARA